MKSGGKSKAQRFRASPKRLERKMVKIDFSIFRHIVYHERTLSVSRLVFLSYVFPNVAESYTKLSNEVSSLKMLLPTLTMQFLEHQNFQKKTKNVHKSFLNSYS